MCKESNGAEEFVGNTNFMVDISHTELHHENSDDDTHHNAPNSSFFEQHCQNPVNMPTHMKHLCQNKYLLTAMARGRQQERDDSPLVPHSGRSISRHRQYFNAQPMRVDSNGAIVNGGYDWPPILQRHLYQPASSIQHYASKPRTRARSISRVETIPGERMDNNAHLAYKDGGQRVPCGLTRQHNGFEFGGPASNSTRGLGFQSQASILNHDHRGCQLQHVPQSYIHQQHQPRSEVQRGRRRSRSAVNIGRAEHANLDHCKENDEGYERLLASRERRYELDNSEWGDAAFTNSYSSGVEVPHYPGELNYNPTAQYSPRQGMVQNGSSRYQMIHPDQCSDVDHQAHDASAPNEIDESISYIWPNVPDLVDDDWKYAADYSHELKGPSAIRGGRLQQTATHSNGHNLASGRDEAHEYQGRSQAEQAWQLPRDRMERSHVSDHASHYFQDRNVARNSPHRVDKGLASPERGVYFIQEQHSNQELDVTGHEPDRSPFINGTSLPYSSQTIPHDQLYQFDDRPVIDRGHNPHTRIDDYQLEVRQHSTRSRSSAPSQRRASMSNDQDAPLRTRPMGSSFSSNTHRGIQPPEQAPASHKGRHRSSSMGRSHSNGINGTASQPSGIMKRKYSPHFLSGQTKAGSNFGDVPVKQEEDTRNLLSSFEPDGIYELLSDDESETVAVAKVPDTRQPAPKKPKANEGQKSAKNPTTNSTKPARGRKPSTVQQKKTTPESTNGKQKPKKGKAGQSDAASGRSPVWNGHVNGGFDTSALGDRRPPSTFNFSSTAGSGNGNFNGSGSASKCTYPKNSYLSRLSLNSRNFSCSVSPVNSDLDNLFARNSSSALAMGNRHSNHSNNHRSIHDRHPDQSQQNTHKSVHNAQADEFHGQGFDQSGIDFRASQPCGTEPMDVDDIEDDGDSFEDVLRSKSNHQNERRTSADLGVLKIADRKSITESSPTNEDARDSSTGLFGSENSTETPEVFKNSLNYKGPDTESLATTSPRQIAPKVDKASAKDLSQGLSQILQNYAQIQEPGKTTDEASTLFPPQANMMGPGHQESEAPTSLENNGTAPPGFASPVTSPLTKDGTEARASSVSSRVTPSKPNQISEQPKRRGRPPKKTTNTGEKPNTNNKHEDLGAVNGITEDADMNNKTNPSETHRTEPVNDVSAVTNSEKDPSSAETEDAFFANRNFVVDANAAKSLHAKKKPSGSSAVVKKIVNQTRKEARQRKRDINHGVMNNVLPKPASPAKDFKSNPKSNGQQAMSAGSQTTREPANQRELNAPSTNRTAHEPNGSLSTKDQVNQANQLVEAQGEWSSDNENGPTQGKKEKHTPIPLNKIGRHDLILLNLRSHGLGWREAHPMWQEMTGRKIREDSLRQRCRRLEKTLCQGMETKGEGNTDQANGAKTQIRRKRQEQSPSRDDAAAAPKQPQRPTTGGKTINAELMKQLFSGDLYSDESASEPEPEPTAAEAEETVASREPSPITDADKCHFAYQILRKTWPTDEDDADYEWSRIEPTYTSLEEANRAAADEFRHERRDANVQIWPMRSHKWEFDELGQSHWHGESANGYYLRVSVDRYLRTFHDAQLPESKKGWLPRKIYAVLQKVTSFQVDSDGGMATNNIDPHSKPTENVLSTNTAVLKWAYTIQDMANREASKSFQQLKASLDPTRGRKRMDAVIAEQKETDKLLDSLEKREENFWAEAVVEDDDAMSGSARTRYEVFVAEDTLKGARNL
ncbi:MAG: hypothetical protein M1831_005086 [Alyxoria varia]|nr:MAG: hypothetical protein M1831_005086 [Alyxoria varia]